MTVALESVPVLVIDDNDFIREAVSVMLTDIGFREIAQARDGNDGLRQLEKVNPGLIICDVSMKPMDGLSFVEALRRQSWAGAARVPVIFLTVHTENAIVAKAVKLGVKAYVVKPVQKKQLEARILTVLENA